MQGKLGLDLFSIGELEVYLWLHPSEDPSQEVWDAAVEQVRARMESKRVRPENTRWLVVTDGGAPNAKQRGQMAAVMRGKPYPIAVVTTALTNPMKRGVATALTWLNPKFGFFQPSQFDQALAHVGLESERGRVWVQLRKLQLRLDPIRAMRMIADATALPLDE